MFRAWSKIVVTSLVILGVDVFASDNNQRIDESFEAASKAVQLSLPAVLDDIGSGWQPFLAGANTIQPNINLTYRAFSIVTVPLSVLLKYNPFSPRAPPVPAS